MIQQSPSGRCPKCGARLATANVWHSCGKYTLKELFAKSEPYVFRMFRKYERMVRACGPVTMIPQKTRVVFMVRVRHAGAYPRKNHLLCSFALPYKCEDPWFVKIEQHAPHFVGHHLRIDSEDQLDAKVQKWLREWCAVGTQEVLRTRKRRNNNSHI